MPSADNASLTSGRLHKVAKTLALNPPAPPQAPHSSAKIRVVRTLATVATLQLKEQIFLSVPPFLKLDAHNSLFSSLVKPIGISPFVS